MRWRERTQAFIYEAKRPRLKQEENFKNKTSLLFYPNNFLLFRIYQLATVLFVVKGTVPLFEQWILRWLHQLHYTRNIYWCLRWREIWNAHRQPRWPKTTKYIHWRACWNKTTGNVYLRLLWPKTPRFPGVVVFQHNKILSDPTGVFNMTRNHWSLLSWLCLPWLWTTNDIFITCWVPDYGKLVIVRNNTAYQTDL